MKLNQQLTICTLALLVGNVKKVHGFANVGSALQQSSSSSVRLSMVAQSQDTAVSTAGPRKKTKQVRFSVWR